jgi:hypothetical protein
MDVRNRMRLDMQANSALVVATVCRLDWRTNVVEVQILLHERLLPMGARAKVTAGNTTAAGRGQRQCFARLAACRTKRAKAAAVAGTRVCSNEQ